MLVKFEQNLVAIMQGFADHFWVGITSGGGNKLPKIHGEAEVFVWLWRNGRVERNDGGLVARKVCRNRNFSGIPFFALAWAVEVGDDSCDERLAQAED